MRYGKLTVIGDSPKRATNGNKYALVRCDCGVETEKQIYAMKSGNTLSCGCEQGGQRTHGMSGTQEYRAWLSMWSRCTRKKNKAYKDYGGRGISVCTRWASFENFLADVGLKPTAEHRLDRHDNEGNYTPNNCGWVTVQDSNTNTRATLRVHYQGEHMSLAEAARLAEVPYKTAHHRYHLGLPLYVVLQKGRL